MVELDALTVFVLPIGLGLIGFVEPCSIGSTLVFIKYLEGRDARAKVAQVVLFTAARALFTGTLGLAAVTLGAAFTGVQRGGWVLLGTLYVAIGLLLAAGRGQWMSASLGRWLSPLKPGRGSLALGVLFGLNLPACSAPLIVALLAAAAAGGAAGATYAAGFTALALFGLALSAPLVAAVFFEPARRAFDRLAALSHRIPIWTGVVLILLGLWSIRFALVADLGV